MLRSIPSPNISVWEIGPLTIHMYALCIIAGIALAIWLGNKRFITFGAHTQSVVSEVAIYCVPAGIIGGRIYHVITSPDAYFGSNGNPLDALKIWNGGLGIWGAISLGAFVAWIRYRQLAKNNNLPSFGIFLDALAPGILLAQAIGRFGNWFNIELFGRPLDAPWALEVPQSFRPSAFRDFETFHPTFLYESLWCLTLALLIIWMGTRAKPGQIFAIYILGYCIGRFFIESLRIDDAHLLAGMRINEWVSIVVGGLALSAYLRLSKASGRL
jgi:prolipoprotein diacylglyceryl transferase